MLDASLAAFHSGRRRLMQLDPPRFAHAVRAHVRNRAARRIAFDLQLSNGDVTPGFVESYGDGVFRLRLGPHTLPDYGLVLAQAQALDASIGTAGAMRVAAGESALLLEQDPLRVVLERRGAPILTSITDEHFRGSTRLPAFGRDGERWIASLALQSGEPVYGLGEKFSSLNRR